MSRTIRCPFCGYQNDQPTFANEVRTVNGLFVCPDCDRVLGGYR
jgi:transposase